jgi:hypothetical protein
VILCLESLNIILSYGLARVFGLSREGAQAALHQPRGADEVPGAGGGCADQGGWQARSMEPWADIHGRTHGCTKWAGMMRYARLPWFAVDV